MHSKKEDTWEEQFPLKRFQIVSLWDMQKFYADKFLKMIRALDYVKALAQHCGPAGLQGKDDELRKSLNNACRQLCTMLNKLGLKVSLCSAGRLKAHIKTANQVGPAFCTLVDDVGSRLEDELQSSLFLSLTERESSYYKQDVALLGEVIPILFAQLEYDIEESGKCYAVGRYTACVFHLMRIMEFFVQQLGCKLNVAIVEGKNWQTILNDMRSELNKISTNPKDKIRMRYSRVIEHLEAVKTAWRNPTMHPGYKYTEEEAQDILQTVKIFVQGIMDVL